MISNEEKRLRDRERHRAYYAVPQNREKARAKSRANYASKKHDPVYMERRRENNRRDYDNPVTKVRIKETRARSKEKHREANNFRSRMHEYRISRDELKRLLEHTTCGICGKPDLSGPDQHIDHNHRTGKVRGVLCRSCNIALGGFRDSAALLKRAIRYLERRTVKAPTSQLALPILKRAA